MDGAFWRMATNGDTHSTIVRRRWVVTQHDGIGAVSSKGARQRTGRRVCFDTLDTHELFFCVVVARVFISCTSRRSRCMLWDGKVNEIISLRTMYYVCGLACAFMSWR